MKKVWFITVIILLVGISQIYAQTDKPYFGIYGALAMPTGDFGSDAYDLDSGGATTFVGAGVEYTYPIGSPGLSWVSNVSFIMNGVDDNFLVDALGVDDADGGHWINIPVMTGLKYQKTMPSSNMGIYGMVQAGLNIVKGASFDVEWTDYYGHSKVSATSDMTTSFGFSFGGGIILKDKYTVGFRYLMLGEPELTWEDDSGDYKLEKDQPISIFLITVGMRL